jgi:hypothetical protein
MPRMPRLLLLSRPAGLPASLATLGAPCYLHRTPTRLLWPLLALALAVVLGGLVLVGVWVARGQAGLAEGAFGAFLLLFAVVLVRPRTWRPHIALAADARGLFFLGTSEVEPAVFVPWSEVGPMSIARRSTGSSGSARTVVLSIADTSDVWVRAKQSRFLGLMLGPPDADGRRDLPIGNVGLRPEDTRDALEALRSRAEGAT